MHREVHQEQFLEHKRLTDCQFKEAFEQINPFSKVLLAALII